MTMRARSSLVRTEAQSASSASKRMRAVSSRPSTLSGIGPYRSRSSSRSSSISSWLLTHDSLWWNERRWARFSMYSGGTLSSMPSLMSARIMLGGCQSGSATPLIFGAWPLGLPPSPSALPPEGEGRECPALPVEGECVDWPLRVCFSISVALPLGDCSNLRLSSSTD